MTTASSFMSGPPAASSRTSSVSRPARCPGVAAEDARRPRQQRPPRRVVEQQSPRSPRRRRPTSVVPTYRAASAVHFAGDRRVADEDGHAAGQRLERRQAEPLVVGQEHERPGPGVERRAGSRRRRTTGWPCDRATPAARARASRSWRGNVRLSPTISRRTSGWRLATARHRLNRLGKVASVEDRAHEEHQRLPGVAGARRTHCRQGA